MPQRRAPFIISGLASIYHDEGRDRSLVSNCLVAHLPFSPALDLLRDFVVYRIGPSSTSGVRRRLNPFAGKGSGRKAAFTLVEVLVSVGIIGVLVMALYAALTSSVAMVRSCQQNERVTQILSDKMDTVRLYNWDQITNRFVLTNFVLGIDPIDANSRPYYTGRIAIAYAPITETYRTNLMHVTVTVDWMAGARLQSRSMSTYVAKYGLQSYIMR